MHKIDKNILGVAGEFAVAAELCRRNIYAQPTFGNQKRMDLLAFGPAGEMLRLEVKTKQGGVWSNCRGIHGAGVFLVFVDFAGKEADARPDFYVLSAAEWREVALAEMGRYETKHPERRVILGEDNVLRLPDEVNAQGHEYCGVGVHPEYVTSYREAWHKVQEALAQSRSAGTVIQQVHP